MGLKPGPACALVGEGEFGLLYVPFIIRPEICSGCFGQGQTPTFARQSYVEVLCLKLKVRAWFMERWLGTQAGKIPIEAMSKINAVFCSSWANMRANLTPYPNSKPANNSWRVGWGTGVSEVVDLLEELVCDVSFDARYKDAIKAKLDVSDFMAYDSVQVRLKAVEDQLKVDLVRQDAAGIGASLSIGAGSAPAGGSTKPTAGPADGSTPMQPPSSLPAVAGARSPHSNFDSMSDHDKARWQKHIDKQISTYIQLIPDDGSASDLQLAIKESALATIHGDPTGLVLMHFDSKQFGEPITRPEYRIVPLRDAPYVRLVQAVLGARLATPPPNVTKSGGNATTPILGTGDVAVLLDGGRRGNMARLLAPWKEGVKAMTKKGEEEEVAEEIAAEDEEDESTKPPAGFVPTLLQIAFTEESVANARRRNQYTSGLARLSQVEWVHIVASNKISLPARKRLHYPGSTVGDLITGLELEPPSDEWQMSWAEKKDYYGRKFLVAVGGKTEVAPEDAAKGPRSNQSMFPVCHHCMPEKFYEEMIHTFFAKCVIDLSPASGKFAWVALKSKIGYVGITYTKSHAHLLRAHLVDLMKREMAVPASKVYNAEYAIATGATVAASENGNAKSKNKRKTTEAMPSKTTKPKLPKKSAAKEEEPRNKKAKTAKKTEAEAAGSENEGDEGEDQESEDPDDIWDPLAVDKGGD